MSIVFLIYGIVIGSFLNVLILRIPSKEEFVKTRSHCMNCDYQLKWYDLVPVISYISLGGKCRKCKTKISIQYPIIELLNGAAYLGIYLLWNLSFESLIACVVFSIMLVIFVIDLRHKIIPNGLVVATLLMGVIATIMDKQYLEHIIGLFSVSIFLILLTLITRKPLGLGDIKLMAAAGLLLGWKKIILALMLGSIVGSLIGIALIGFKVINRKEPIAFGPFLTSGIVTAMIFGDEIIDWYINTILYM